MMSQGPDHARSRCLDVVSYVDYFGHYPKSLLKVLKGWNNILCGFLESKTTQRMELSEAGMDVRELLEAKAVRERG